MKYIILVMMFGCANLDRGDQHPDTEQPPVHPELDFPIDPGEPETTSPDAPEVAVEPDAPEVTPPDACEPVLSCMRDADCGHGNTCRNGKCYVYEFCQSDADCVPGNECRYGLCKQY
jgi:Cys-rich repeat protein